MNSSEIKAKYLEVIGKLNLAPEDAIIILGASMTVRGLKKASKSLDIVVDSVAFSGIRQHAGLDCVVDVAEELLNPPTTKPQLIFDGIKFIENDDQFKEGESEVVNGIGLQSIASIHRLMLAIGRPKDELSIRIMEFLINYPHFKVPNISIALMVREKAARDDVPVRPPRQLGFMVMAVGFGITATDIKTLREYGVSQEERDFITGLLIPKYDFRWTDVIGEFCTGAECALGMHQYQELPNESV